MDSCCGVHGVMRCIRGQKKWVNVEERLKSRRMEQEAIVNPESDNIHSDKFTGWKRNSSDLWYLFNENGQVIINGVVDTDLWN